MDLSAPVDDEELEKFRSTWRQEIKKGRNASCSGHPSEGQSQSPRALTVQSSAPQRSEEDASSGGADRVDSKSPLEVYESAILKERQGSLSEAVIRYRRAFKMDPDVDKHYKLKYFPAGGIPLNSRPPNDELQLGYSTQEYRASSYRDTLPTLIASFDILSRLRIEPEDPQKPCYLAIVPDEILLNILLHLFLRSLSSISRISLVSKKLFALSTTENSLYKTLCMHYFHPFDPPSVLLNRIGEYNNDWRRLLIERPRLRFDGVYIATCHYLRPGVNEYSWNSPIHIVTYFRFARFYPDGSCITVLTTSEPKEVVYSVSWVGVNGGLKGASDGVWKMSESGGVSVEVRGPRGYTFVKELQIKSTSRGKHNKLVWVGFSSVNQDDGEKTALSMKNEKSFYFSRVRSYGDGL